MCLLDIGPIDLIVLIDRAGEAIVRMALIAHIHLVHIAITAIMEVMIAM